ncbi:lipoprotein [Planobispora rosea]|uniref:Lipoprotein n=1 Tax=Planobispora rosea TaxID=35762 RepID=A0A8J3WH58_PLARO|nr:lipoprotein [Planobispora rosea]
MTPAVTPAVIPTMSQPAVTTATSQPTTTPHVTSAPQIAITPQATITSQPAVTPRMTAAPQPTTAPTPPPGPEAGTRQARLFTNGRWQPEKVRVPRSGSGRYRVVPGQARPPRGKGKVVRYIVEVERGLPFDREEFALQVHRILNDPRGWGFRFHRVSRGPVDIRVSLSSPAMTDRRCLPLRTLGLLSCWNGGRAVINAMRWNEGAPGYRGDVASYREYVISHEVGHGLGHGHVSCPGRGRRAPVMLQQTKSLHGCRPNPWPFPERGPRALG